MNPTSDHALKRFEEPKLRSRFRETLLNWYDRKQRKLPWRLNRDPYRVWVAEVMLQQTRVATVLSYYDRFFQRFPTVQTLAAARLDSVLAAWSGLGYYRRARLLHAAARQIVNHDRGRFPTSAEDWQKLPGVGRYTAAAIASIAFQQAIAAVDGNVERVLSRLAGEDISGERSWTLAQLLLSSERPGDANQAMMELGATVCLPRGPECLLCPVFDLCATRGELVSSTISRRQTKEIYYNLSVRHGRVLLTRRSRTASLMAGMWELPEMKKPQSGFAQQPALMLRHSITVTDYRVRVCQNGHREMKGARWFPQSQLSGLPLTGLTRKILRTAGLI